MKTATINQKTLLKELIIRKFGVNSNFPMLGDTQIFFKLKQFRTGKKWLINKKGIIENIAFDDMKEVLNDFLRTPNIRSKYWLD